MKTRSKFYKEGGEVDPPKRQFMGMQDIGRIRRTGSLPGWENVPNKDGSVTFKKQNDISTLIKNFPKVVDDAVHTYPGITRQNWTDPKVELPGMEANRQINRFLGLTPEIKSATYGELNWAMVPGFQSNQSGRQGEITEFDYVQNAPNVDTGLQPLKTQGQIPLQPSSKKGLPNVLYTPDGVKMSDYIQSLKRQTANNKIYNSRVDVVNSMKSRYNQALDGNNTMPTLTTRAQSDNPTRKFNNGGSLTMNNKRKDILKKGIDVTLYPLPFRKGGKIMNAGLGDKTIQPGIEYAGGGGLPKINDLGKAKMASDATRTVNPRAEAMKAGATEKLAYYPTLSAFREKKYAQSTNHFVTPERIESPIVGRGLGMYDADSSTQQRGGKAYGLRKVLGAKSKFSK